MTLGSLFSGIGGMDLGLERAGMTVRWQVEIDPFCSRVLEKHWPETERHEDVRDCQDLPRVDLIAGGFPCQDLSHARPGRKGLAGSRSGLWMEMMYVVYQGRPKWVVVENVHHAWRSWVPRVRVDLWGAGYASLPLALSATDVGGDHLRRRAFVVAHADGNVLRQLAWRWSGPHGQVATEPLDPRWGTAASRVARVDDGVADGMDRRRAIGNAVVPQVAEVIGRAIMEAA